MAPRSASPYSDNARIFSDALSHFDTYRRKWPFRRAIAVDAPEIVSYEQSSFRGRRGYCAGSCHILQSGPDC